jgi:hypothetical protein
MEAEELDQKFDRGEDISQYLDLSKTRRVARERKKANVDYQAREFRQMNKKGKHLRKE